MTRVLFVDDEPQVLEGLRRVLRLQRVPWMAVFVPSGQAALAELETAPFDVLVADLQMPGMDGMTLLAAVKERYPNVVRIVLTAHTELQAAVRALWVAHLFLTKPCDAPTLQLAVERACSLQALLADDVLKRQVSGIASLPSLPRAFAALTRALAEPEVSLKRVADIVQQDVGMCAKILQIANSGFFALPRQVTNVQAAIGVLGTNMLKNLVLSVEVFRAFEGGRRAGFALEELHRHGLVAAAIARRLLPDRQQAEDAFMAGMLHVVGRLVLATRLPDEFSKVLEMARAQGCPLHEVERERLGVTHAEVGAYLLGLWSLPYPIVEAVAHHHEPRRVPHRGFDLVTAVHVACVLAREQTRREGDPEPVLDQAMLEELGVGAQLTAWRALAAEQAGVAVAA
jgi:HD-like signal output (HDOD) protein